MPTLGPSEQVYSSQHSAREDVQANWLMKQTCLQAMSASIALEFCVSGLLDTHKAKNEWHPDTPTELSYCAVTTQGCGKDIEGASMTAA